MPSAQPQAGDEPRQCRDRRRVEWGGIGARVGLRHRMRRDLAVRLARRIEDRVAERLAVALEADVAPTERAVVAVGAGSGAATVRRLVAAVFGVRVHALDRVGEQRVDEALVRVHAEDEVFLSLRQRDEVSPEELVCEVVQVLHALAVSVLQAGHVAIGVALAERLVVGAQKIAFGAERRAAEDPCAPGNLLTAGQRYRIGELVGSGAVRRYVASAERGGRRRVTIARRSTREDEGYVVVEDGE